MGMVDHLHSAPSSLGRDSGGLCLLYPERDCPSLTSASLCGPIQLARVLSPEVDQALRPVWGAVALAVATFWISPRTAEMPSVWIEQRPVAVTGGEVLRDLTLVTGNGGLASPLWSLQWEILFSLLLPIYIWFALKLRGHPLIAVAGCLLLIAVGGALHAVRFLPMFAIGVVLAVALPELTSVATRFSSGKSANMRWFLLTALGALMLSSHWLVAPLNPAPIVQRGSSR